MSEPTVTCQTCFSKVTVEPAGRGFPPDVAKRKLAKVCKAKGHESDPKYRAGVRIGGPVTGQGESEGEHYYGTVPGRPWRRPSEIANPGRPETSTWPEEARIAALHAADWRCQNSDLQLTVSQAWLLVSDILNAVAPIIRAEGGLPDIKINLVNLTIIAERLGHSLSGVHSWTTRFPDWPEPLLTGDGRGAMHVYWWPHVQAFLDRHNLPQRGRGGA